MRPGRPLVRRSAHDANLRSRRVLTAATGPDGSDQADSAPGRLNSPSLAPATKARHSPGVKISAGPSGFFASRSPILPLARKATSTPPSPSPLRCQTAPGSISRFFASNLCSRIDVIAHRPGRSGAVVLDSRRSAGRVPVSFSNPRPRAWPRSHRCPQRRNVAIVYSPAQRRWFTAQPERKPSHCGGYVASYR